MNWFKTDYVHIFALCSAIIAFAGFTSPSEMGCSLIIRDNVGATFWFNVRNNQGDKDP